MGNKAIVGIIIVVIIVVGGFFLLRGGSSQMSQPNTPPTQQSSMPMQMQSSGTGSNTPSSAPTTAAKNEVQIANFAFSPSTLTVKVGDTVTWTNQDSVGHSATADNGSFDTGVLAQGKSGTVTFNKAGTYAYHCSVHPNMHGTIIVQ